MGKREQLRAINTSIITPVPDNHKTNLIDDILSPDHQTENTDKPETIKIQQSKPLSETIPTDKKGAVPEKTPLISVSDIPAIKTDEENTNSVGMNTTVGTSSSGVTTDTRPWFDQDLKSRILDGEAFTKAYRVEGQYHFFLKRRAGQLHIPKRLYFNILVKEAHQKFEKKLEKNELLFNNYNEIVNFTDNLSRGRSVMSVEILPEMYDFLQTDSAELGMNMTEYVNYIIKQEIEREEKDGPRQ